MVEAFETVVEKLRLSGQHALWSLGLEKPQRILLAPRNESLKLVSLRPEVVQPALSSVLLGAIPEGPGMLLSLGREVRIALIDSTLTYREYRIAEGGGMWWQAELEKLSQHSLRLRTHLKAFAEGKPPLRSIPQLLDLGRYPTPDPVLKPRLEKIAGKLVKMALNISSRLPGLKRFALSGYLANSALGELIKKGLNEEAPQLKFKKPQFPPEVGSALMALAFERENWERDHLGKEIFSQDRSDDSWSPPQALVRRLYKLRKPFERYS